MPKLNVLMVDLKSDLPSPPFQLGLLAAYARTNDEVRRDITFTFSGHAREESATQVAKTILDAAPDVVAVSHYSWNHGQLCRTLELLAASGGRMPRIVLGGANAAGKFGALMLRRYPIISAVVEGEGEPAFLDICASLVDSAERNPFIAARNCRFRDRAGDVVALNLGHRIKDLDEVPSPYLTGLLPTFPSPVLYETNRGCPYRCAFCYWGNGNSRINCASPERVREEIAFFAKQKVRSLLLADANFGIFETDVDVARVIAEENARHGYPFKFVGVNYAKNSRERVLEIASVLRSGKVFTSTTLALQSVTPEAEKLSKRYSIAPDKFTHLVRAAHDRDLSTYTDLILGLPGETVQEFVDSLTAVIASGIPAVKIHQLSVLPGTEFYDRQEEFGLVTIAQADPVKAATKGYDDFLLHSHPKLSNADLHRGLRVVGINHLLHNHNLGTIVNFYLARHGASPRDIYDFFDRLVMDDDREWFDAPNRLLSTIRRHVRALADGHDAYECERALSMEIWFGGRGVRGTPNLPEVSGFMHAFYSAFCRHHGLRLNADEHALLEEMIDYNLLVAPKPRWRPDIVYRFEHDVHAIWIDMMRVLHDGAPAGRTGSWQERLADVLAALRSLLDAPYIAERRRPSSYHVSNPLPVFPSGMALGWVVSNRDWFCRVSPIAEMAESAAAALPA